MHFGRNTHSFDPYVHQSTCDKGYLVLDPILWGKPDSQASFSVCGREV